MSDDQVGWRNEEVVDPLESCADGVMYFSHTGLRNYLSTMIQSSVNIDVGIKTLTTIKFYSLLAAENKKKRWPKKTSFCRLISFMQH